MKTIFFHIGQHRTGTSSLQLFLDSNKDSLLEQSVLYPLAGKKDMKGNEHTRHMYLSFRSPSDQESLRELSNEIHNSTANKIIISAEGFCRASVNEKVSLNVSEIFNFLSDFKVKVICYLRPQDDFIESFYNWKVKTGHETRKFDIFVKEFLVEWRDYLFYENLLKPFDNLVGPENIIVKEYNRCTFTNRSIIYDFARLIGIKIHNNFSVPQEDQNSSVQYCSLEILRRVREFLNSPLKENEEFSRIISQILALDKNNLRSQGVSMLSNEMRLEIRTIFHSSNNKVSKRYLQKTSLFERLKPKEHVPAEQLMQFSDEHLYLIVVNFWKNICDNRGIILENKKVIANLEIELKKSLNDYVKLQEKYLLFLKKFVELENHIKKY